jgi:hypothetical protein
MYLAGLLIYQYVSYLSFNITSLITGMDLNEMYFFDSLDPNNRRALEGMHRIDNSSSKLDTSYYMTVGEEEGGDTTYERIADSENEVLCQFIVIIYWCHQEVSGLMQGDITAVNIELIL